MHQSVAWFPNPVDVRCPHCGPTSPLSGPFLAHCAHVYCPADYCLISYILSGDLIVTPLSKQSPCAFASAEPSQGHTLSPPHAALTHHFVCRERHVASAPFRPSAAAAAAQQPVWPSSSAEPGCLKAECWHSSARLIHSRACSTKTPPRRTSWNVAASFHSRN